MPPEESVVVGRFNGPWGVRGWVKVYSHTRPPIAIFDYQPWLLGEHGQSVEVLQWQQAGPRLVVRLPGVETPEQAAALGQLSISVPRSALPPADPGHYYWHDLVGLKVINLQGHVYGRVLRMHETGAHDVLEAGNEETPGVLIPWVMDRYVIKVDLAAGEVLVDWPLDWA